MNNIEILCSIDSDILEQCLKIRNEVFSIEKQVDKNIEVDEYDCYNNKCEHFLIKYNNNNVGALRCLHINNNTIKLQRFCFLKNYRNIGLGKTTLKFIEKYYNKKGYSKIIMDAKFEALGFYEKCGYTKKSDVFVEIGIEHIKMEKIIK